MCAFKTQSTSPRRICTMPTGAPLTCTGETRRHVAALMMIGPSLPPKQVTPRFSSAERWKTRDDQGLSDHQQIMTGNMRLQNRRNYVLGQGRTLA